MISWWKHENTPSVLLSGGDLNQSTQTPSLMRHEAHTCMRPQCILLSGEGWIDGKFLSLKINMLVYMWNESMCLVLISDDTFSEACRSHVTGNITCILTHPSRSLPAHASSPRQPEKKRCRRARSTCRRLPATRQRGESFISTPLCHVAKCISFVMRAGVTKVEMFLLI